MATLYIGSEPNLEYWRSDIGQWAQPVASINYPCGHATIWQAGSRYRYQLETPEGRVVHVSIHESLSIEECAHRSVRALDAYDEGLRHYHERTQSDDDDGFPRFKRVRNASPDIDALDDDATDTAFVVVIALAFIAVGLMAALLGGF